MKKTWNLLSVMIISLFITSDLSAQGKTNPDGVAKGKVGKANVEIKYNSPGVKGRKIWGELVPYGKVWRSGADSCTRISFSSDVSVEGKSLPAGNYAFFTIPGETEWTIILNKNATQWGAFRYDQSLDALRVTVKPAKSAAFTERLAYEVTNKGIVLRWENLEVPVAVK